MCESCQGGAGVAMRHLRKQGVIIARIPELTTLQVVSPHYMKCGPSSLSADHHANVRQVQDSGGQRQFAVGVLLLQFLEGTSDVVQREDTGDWHLEFACRYEIGELREHVGAR